jgi:hypothetical protein
MQRSRGQVGEGTLFVADLIWNQGRKVHGDIVDICVLRVAGPHTRYACTDPRGVDAVAGSHDTARTRVAESSRGIVRLRCLPHAGNASQFSSGTDQRGGNLDLNLTRRGRSHLLLFDDPTAGTIYAAYHPIHALFSSLFGQKIT